MVTKFRRRLAVIIAGALLAALTVINIVPVAADDDNFTAVTVDPSSSMINTDSFIGP